MESPEQIRQRDPNTKLNGSINKFVRNWIFQRLLLNHLRPRLEGAQSTPSVKPKCLNLLNLQVGEGVHRGKSCPILVAVDRLVAYPQDGDIQMHQKFQKELQINLKN